MVHKGAVLSEQGAQQATINIGHQIDIVNNTKQLAETTAIRVGNLVANSVQIGFENTALHITAIEVQQTKSITILERVIKTSYGNHYTKKTC